MGPGRPSQSGAGGAKVKLLFLPLQCGPSWYLWSRGLLQPHPQVLRFSQWCIVCGELFVGLLVRDTEVGDNLHCHLDDITSPIWDFFGGQ